MLGLDSLGHAVLAGLLGAEAIAAVKVVALEQRVPLAPLTAQPRAKRDGSNT